MIPLRRLSNAEQLAAVFGPALIVLLLGLLAYAAVQRTRSGMERVARGHQVSIQLEQIFARLADAEAAERGYIVTHQDRFLEPYWSVREEIREDLDVLRILVLDPTQRQRVETLAQLVEAKLALVDRNIAFRRAGDAAAAEAAVRSGEGKARMDAVRHAVAEIEETQAEIVAARSAAAQRDSRRLGLAILLSTGAALVLAILANLLLARHARAEEALAREVEEQNALLQRQAAELEMQTEELQAQAAHVEEAMAELEMSNDDLQRAHESLQQREAEHAALLKSAGDGIYGIDLEGRCTFINPCGAELLGYAVEEVLGRNMHDLIHHHEADGSEYPQEVCPIYLAAKSGEGVRVDDEVLWRKDGTACPAEYASSPLIVEGAIRGAVVTFRDITERIRAEEERTALLRREKELRKRTQESERQFRAMANSIPQLAWMADETGSIFWYNQRWYDFTGTHPKEMKGWGWRAVHHPEHVEGVVERIRHAFQTGEPWEDTFPLRSADGEYRWFLSRALPIRDDAGRVVRWFGTNTDVTEQRETERALRESQQGTLFLAETIPHLVWITRPDGFHEFYNQRWFEYTGLTYEDTKGEGWNDVLHPDDRQRAWNRWNRSLESGEPYSIEYRFRRQDGDYRWFLGLALPLRDEGGMILRWFGTCTDIHDQKIMEAERDRALRETDAARAEAEAANRTKMDFLSAMSHELRTPLNAIAGYVDLLDMGIYGPTTPGQLQAFDRIRLGQQSLLTLINDILQYAKIEAGRVEYEIRPVSVAEVLSELETLIEPQVHAAGLVYAVDACDPSLAVLADRERVRQILLNLLANAVKFTPAGGRVAISCDGDHRYVRIRVSDTGRGVAAEMIQRIFDPFVQAERHRNASSKQGVGLGLAISRDLAQGMGGDLTVESTLGRGSTFTLILPPAAPDGAERRSSNDRRNGEDRRAIAAANDPRSQ